MLSGNFHGNGAGTIAAFSFQYLLSSHPSLQAKDAWPALKSLPAPVDVEKDGMRDEWEKKNGLNPSDESDASQLKLNRFFTNIEVYINSLNKWER